MNTRLVSLAAILTCAAVAAQADPRVVRLTELNSAVTLTTPFAGNETLLIDTLVTASTGAMSNSVTFTLGTTVDLFGSAAWQSAQAAGNDPRLVGVNVDIFNATNTLVASDSFVGVQSGVAISSLSATLGPGTYRAVISGTGQRASMIDLSLAFAGTAQPQQPPGPLDPLNVLQRSSVLSPPVSAGDTLFLNAAVVGPTGPLRQALTFTTDGSVGGFTSRASWEVSPAGGLGPRLTGVNIDLLDSSDNVLFSDTFSGLLGEFAVSSFAGGLAPGTYTLVATGTAQREVALDVSLTLVAAVPEPETYALMLAGLATIGAVARRRRRTR